MAKCPKCSAQVSASDLACPECGVKFKRRTPEPPPEEDEWDESLDDELAEMGAKPKGKSKLKIKPKGKKSNTGLILLIVGLVVGIPLCCIGPILVALLLPAVQAARNAAREAQARNNMKQMGLAMHNFHDNFTHFPPTFVPGAFIPEGEVPQSWMTVCLPYMDQAPLYNQIQTNKAWSDPANQAQMSTVIPAYLHPSIIERPISPQGYALAHYASNSRMISDKVAIRMLDVSDGLSSTMLAGTVNNGFKPWGDPTNHRDPANGFRGGPDAFGAPSIAGATILLGDGSVRRISPDLDPNIAAALASPAGGEQIPFDF
jgi:hypothetical protein